MVTLSDCSGGIWRAKYHVFCGVGRPWDSHKSGNIGDYPRGGGRVLSSVLETVNGAFAKKHRIAFYSIQKAHLPNLASGLSLSVIAIF